MNGMNYFWVTTIDKWGNESPKVAASPTNAYLKKLEWMKHFPIPWNVESLVIAEYSISGALQTATYTPAAGKVGMIAGYSLTGAGGVYTSIKVNDYVMEYSPNPGTETKLPSETLGMYVENGDHIDIVTGNNAGCAASMIIHEWDADSDISVLWAIVDNAPDTYTVPAGKKFILTYATTRSALGNYLEFSVDGGANYLHLFDPYTDKWYLGIGILQFAAGYKIRMDNTNGNTESYIFGIEVAV